MCVCERFVWTPTLFSRKTEHVFCILTRTGTRGRDTIAIWIYYAILAADLSVTTEANVNGIDVGTVCLRHACTNTTNATINKTRVGSSMPCRELVDYIQRESDNSASSIWLATQGMSEFLLFVVLLCCFVINVLLICGLHVHYLLSYFRKALIYCVGLVSVLFRSNTFRIVNKPSVFHPPTERARIVRARSAIHPNKCQHNAASSAFPPNWLFEAFLRGLACNTRATPSHTTTGEFTIKFSPF